MRQVLAFDDVLLVPKFSNITSRDEVDLSSYLDKQYFIPIISSPMDTITEKDMAEAMNIAGGLGIVHRYMSIEDQVKNISPRCGAAIGATGDYFERAQELVKNNCRKLCIDVAHGHHQNVIDATKKIKKEFGDQVHLMAGNVATSAAVDDLAYQGANSVRVSVGSGSICSTRIMTGHGIPTLQVLFDCQKVRIKDRFPQLKIIADGGIKNSGDAIKCLAAGADFVMLGSVLAGTHETPGELKKEVAKNGYYKIYRGMASKESQIAWRGKVRSIEGVTTKVACKGPVKNILEDFRINLASGLSYSGARNLRELVEKAEFVQQSNASIIESKPHIL